ncbi:hypothetical protein KO481_16870 [Nocardia sp. NEAU-G5]|uniref:Caspase domain-containing protein n=1 Tax=Nocardia albiluteola TaxID=2842303 RepID=A0ABS6B0A2_9NOCA|nr:hypothetical protein [Nocardia albiluteola]MBU3063195.1 hypothetical protein [Nocardia albiluteola]
MAQTTYETVRVVQIGEDRFARWITETILPLAQGLSASGNGRRRFGHRDPRHHDEFEQFVSRPRTPAEAAEALVIPSAITIVVGHGGWGEGLDWQLGSSQTTAVVSIGDLLQRISGPLNTRLLIVDACNADSVADHWRKVLREDAVLGTAVGAVGLPSATRTLTMLFTTLAAIPGAAPLRRDQIIGAIDTTRRCLRLQDDPTERCLRSQDEETGNTHIRDNDPAPGSFSWHWKPQ